jgi:hypothetical protein
MFKNNHHIGYAKSERNILYVKVCDIWMYNNPKDETQVGEKGRDIMVR